MFRARTFAPLLSVALAGVVLTTSGCFWRRTKGGPPYAATPSGQTNFVIAPAIVAAGRVASVNAQARFAVVNFPVGQVPARDTRFAIYHSGQRVGSLRISGPAEGTFTVGDIIAGSAQDGDEVRPE